MIGPHGLSSSFEYLPDKLLSCSTESKIRLTRGFMKNTSRLDLPTRSSFTRSTTLIPDWADMSGRDHFVQIYTEDQQIFDAVSGYFAQGLRLNEVCIMIGCRDHNRVIESLVRKMYPAFDAAMAENRFIVLDAKETLDKFVVNGMPSKDLFDHAVGNVIRNAQGVRKHVRAFGEMVAVLTEDGNAAAAVELEGFWNALANKLSFPSLLRISSRNHLPTRRRVTRLRHLLLSYSRNRTSCDRRIRT
jgi:MEDS: MEthanogen/methylotroph, DcmR Sensory domain